MKTYKDIENNKGVILPLVAIILVFVLLGFSALVIDAGILYSERRLMVTAADAAALGGAKIMEEALGSADISASRVMAEKVAKDLGVANGIKNREDIEVKWNNSEFNRDTITVTVKNNKDLIFARILGFIDTDVAAEAVATWGYVTKLEGGDILPVFTKNSDYQTDHEVFLHSGKFLDNSGDIANGNWGLIDIFGNTSEIAKAFKGLLTGNRMELNYVIDNQTGLNVGNVNNPIEERMQIANALENKEDRIKYMSGLVPIIDWDNIVKQGSSLKLPIESFGVFEIYDVIISEGNDKEQGEGGYKPSEGSKYALYNTPDFIVGDYKSDNVAIEYHDKTDGKHLPKSTIIGKFTGTKVEVRAIVEPGDQTNPNPTVLSAKYSKLIK